MLVYTATLYGDLPARDAKVVNWWSARQRVQLARSGKTLVLRVPKARIRPWKDGVISKVGTRLQGVRIVYYSTPGQLVEPGKHSVLFYYQYNIMVRAIVNE